ncbi:MAG: VWA domain-containing protein [Phycisphaerales bacterium]|nr:MAG: VWA domain-containing protein [Phycisphaerales bacterium]
MSFLSSWSVIAIAAGLTVPPLVALYFLKLKRRVEPIPSTLLWKRAVQDLHVNAPFQKLRRNLLMLLQLLVLLLAAFALGKPILQAPRTHKGIVILMIDHSASMNVTEANGKTRLQIAKEQAKRVVDNLQGGTRAMMSEGDTRAMVVSFSDKATIVSSFDTDRAALKAKIDSIEPTQSRSTLSEAMALAEAHASNLVIAGEPVAPNVSASGSVLLFTDGRIEDAETLVSQRFRAQSIEIVNVAQRADNVGILAMEARRHYERPEQLEVFAEVRNFGPEPVELDATLIIEGRPADVQTVRLEAGLVTAPPQQAPKDEPTDDPAQAATAERDQDGSVRGSVKASVQERFGAPPPGSVAAVAFDDIIYEGGGVIEVRLQVDDALSADNRAWTVVQPPRSTDVLLVTDGNLFLERVLPTLPVRLTRMSPQEYESADDAEMLEATRSKYDVVIFDRHSTDRLPPGNYFFWGGVPDIEGVSAGEAIADEVIVNWDETHPVLRHVAVENIQVFQWSRLTLPSEVVHLMDGETSPVLAYLARDGRQYLICAFGLLVADEETQQPLLNTFWVTQTHFPMFVYNSVQYLSASLATRGLRNIHPGEPVMIPIADRASKIRVRRPDGSTDVVQTLGSDTVPYARTRTVGIYRSEPGIDGQDRFAVNLFSSSESNVAANDNFTIGADVIAGSGGIDTVNKPIWPYLLLAVLVIVLLEWVIYNKRVFV